MTFSLSGFITSVENDIVTTEADIEQIIAQIQSGIGVLIADIMAVEKYVASVAPGWATTLQSLLALAQGIPGLTIPSVVLSSIEAAIAALQAVATNVQAGTASTPTTAVSAYSALVSAGAAKAALQTAVTAVPTPAQPAAAN